MRLRCPQQLRPRPVGLGRERTTLTQEVELIENDDAQGRLSLISIDADTDAQLLGGEGRFIDLYFHINETVGTECVDVAFNEDVVGMPVLLMDRNDEPVATHREDGSFCVATIASAIMGMDFSTRDVLLCMVSVKLALRSPPAR